jgi:hypothetical protein
MPAPGRRAGALANFSRWKNLAEGEIPALSAHTKIVRKDVFLFT